MAVPGKWGHIPGPSANAQPAVCTTRWLTPRQLSTSGQWSTSRSSQARVLPMGAVELITYIFLVYYTVLLMHVYSTRSSDSQTELIVTVVMCVMAGCCMWINTQHTISYYERKAEKGLLTTLSSCCNSMRAGMQQKGRNGELGEGGGERGTEQRRESKSQSERERERLWVALVGPGSIVSTA